MVDMAKIFSEVFIGFIFIQILAVAIATMTNFSALGILIAGFLDVILMALLISYVAKKF